MFITDITNILSVSRERTLAQNTQGNWIIKQIKPVNTILTTVGTTGKIYNNQHIYMTNIKCINFNINNL